MIKRWSGLSCICLLAACAKSPPAQSSNDVKCPAGQTFDGKFCQVDQNVATAETATEPKNSEAETEQPSEQDKTEEPTSELSPEEQAAADVAGAESGVAVTEEEEIEPEQATPVDYGMAAQASPIMQYVASSHLPAGARALGAPFAGQFAEGQVLAQKVQMSSEKCYTVVAVGLPPVSELNLEVSQEASKEVLLKDTTTGPQAVIGSRSECFVPPTTGAYRVIMTAEKGQGIAAAQVFQK